MNFGSKCSVRLHAVAASLCLLVYLQATGVLPAFIGLSASLEGCHAVSLSRTREQVSVVLRHGETAVAGNLRHHHGWASRIVCALGKGEQSSQADHIARFSSDPTCEQAQVKKNAAESLPEAGVATISNSISTPSPSHRDSHSTPSGWDSTGALRATRTTVLLI
jgi:hypothetical protein